MRTPVSRKKPNRIRYSATVSLLPPSLLASLQTSNGVSPTFLCNSLASWTQPRALFESQQNGKPAALILGSGSFSNLLSPDIPARSAECVGLALRALPHVGRSPKTHNIFDVDRITDLARSTLTGYVSCQRSAPFTRARVERTRIGSSTSHSTATNLSTFTHCSSESLIWS
jgi:hypothetical protein